MCVSIPARVLSKTDSRAMVDVFGHRKEVFMACGEADVGVGDWVLLHGNIALHRLEPDAAEETINLLSKLRRK